MQEKCQLYRKQSIGEEYSLYNVPHSLQEDMCTPKFFWVFSQVSPIRCIVLLNMFISLLYMFRASMCPSSGENYCIYTTLVFVTLYGWRLVCRSDSIQPADQTPPTKSDKYQCRIDTVIFSWWWAHGCPKHVEKRNEYIKQNCARSWTYLRNYTGLYGQQNIGTLLGL